ncbi:MAG TPA: Re/Si-specific NAD(P)(+) transhydrogenase subunit alpha [Firmicutes bacterium]|nr:Re/Si-specific NAD(P)(+) transhydrogenase subunit alpha [Bacillota bacterium]
MKIGVWKEQMPGERRVALVPESIVKLKKVGLEVLVEKGAGAASFISDRLYEEAGATVVADRTELTAAADIIVKVQRPLGPDGDHAELDAIPEGKVLIALLQPLVHPKVAGILASRRVTSFSLDAIPRISRAQNMDVLSAMSSIAGYKAVLIAANSLGKYLPMLTTAAGTIPPSRGLILGAGVAGLQAIATARRLGAVVEAFDVRPAVKEQVESLGATFVEVDYGQATEDKGGYAKELTEDAQRRQKEKIHERIKLADFVITTALIPGRRAPILVTAEMVADMKPGSVIVDLAAEMGGNCELTTPDQTVIKHDVIIHGPSNLPSEMAAQSSQLFSRNLTNFLLLLHKNGQLNLDFNDVIIKDCCITHAGEIKHGRTAELLAAQKGS